MNYSKNSNNKRKKDVKKKRKKGRVYTIFTRFLLFTFLLLCFIFIGAGLGVYVGVIQSAPALDTMAIVPKNYTTFMYDKDGNEMDRLHSEENRVYAKLDKIPKNLQNAFISIEDERFYKHSGIDIKSIARAIVVNLKSMSFSEGASTITQQLIKNNFLKDNQKKLNRKIQEQYLALKFESLLEDNFTSKEEAKDYILELYLNSIGLDHNYNGVQAAARGYFNKDVSELSLAECASIAGITKYPVNYSPRNNYEKNKERQKLVLNYMLKQEFINQVEYDEAINEDLKSTLDASSQLSQEEETSQKTYYEDAVINSVVKALVENGKALNEADATNLVYSGGLSIKTPFDKRIQIIVDDAFQNPNLIPNNSGEMDITYALSVINKNDEKDQKHFEKSLIVSNLDEIEALKKEIQDELIKEPYQFLIDKVVMIPQPQAATIIIDHNKGQVVALAGGVGDKTISRSFNRATQAKRQPGSTFKILAAYAPAIDKGLLSPASVLIDEPYNIDGYTPRNYDYKHHGPTSVRTAITWSRNIVTVKASLLAGIDTVFDYLLNFGFTTLADVGDREDGKTDKVNSLALGGLTEGVTLEELTAAYGTIANQGVHLEASYFTEVLDHNGEVLLSQNTEERRVIKDSTAFLLIDMMKDVIQKGTGSATNFPNMAIAGKTGTTSDNKDVLFAGFSPYYSVSVWIGYDRYDRPNQISGSYHLAIWREIMSKIHSELENKDFPMPASVIKTTACAISGKVFNPDLCTESVTDYFAKGEKQGELCTEHEAIIDDEKISICSVSGKLTNQYCPKETTIRVEKDIAIYNIEDVCDYHNAENSSIDMGVDEDETIDDNTIPIEDNSNDENINPNIDEEKEKD